LFDEANGRMDVQGWITLTNNSGTPYVNADTLLVAGAVGQGQRQRAAPPPPASQALRQAGTESAAASGSATSTSIRCPSGPRSPTSQTKQVSFLDVQARRPRAPMNIATPGSARRPAAKRQHRAALLELARPGPGRRAPRPAPSGSISATPAAIRNSSAKARSATRRWAPNWAFVTGQAFDVKVKPVVERRERLGTDRWRTTMRYTLTNARPNAVTVDLMQSGLWGDTRITQESMPSERRSADDALWRVPVPANGEAVVTATFDTRY
jgi:hypothetical protein